MVESEAKRSVELLPKNCDTKLGFDTVCIAADIHVFRCKFDFNSSLTSIYGSVKHILFNHPTRKLPCIKTFKCNFIYWCAKFLASVSEDTRAFDTLTMVCKFKLRDA